MGILAKEAPHPEINQEELLSGGPTFIGQPRGKEKGEWYKLFFRVCRKFKMDEGYYEDKERKKRLTGLVVG